MNFIIKKGTKQDQSKGTWWKMKEGDNVPILIKCPECGGIGALDHEIKGNGEVNPSLDCPTATCS